MLDVEVTVFPEDVAVIAEVLFHLFYFCYLLMFATGL